LGLVRFEWLHPVASVAALVWLALHPGQIIRRRRQPQSVRKVPDSALDGVIYQGSVAAQYFLRGNRTVSSLPFRAGTRGASHG
jgi:hypothetical protein